MDGNKDESERCILIAHRNIAEGNVGKALKFLHKAQRLFPSQKAKDLIEEINNINTNNSGRRQSDPRTDSNCDDGVRQRRGSGPHEAKESAQTEVKEKEYTSDQLDAVKKVKRCKDYYEILGVTREATESDLKKSYRKLALQFHPDKNKAPGATDAFKAIGNAFSVLSEPEKRRKYDLYGAESEQVHHHRSDHDYSRGFEADISAEELFNIFFGGGYPSNHVNRRNHSHTQYRARETQTNEGGVSLLIQLAPILLLVVLSVMSSFFVSDPIFSLQRSDKYAIERQTSNMRIKFYVKDDYRPDTRGEVRRLERYVEDEFVGSLRSNCFKERNYKENMVWRARNYGDVKLYEKAQRLTTPSCDRLQEIYS